MMRRRPSRPSRPSRPGARAYAMILMLTIAMVMGMISIALVNSTTNDLGGSRLLLGRSEARVLATSALDEFYARFKANPAFLDPLLYGTDPSSLNHLAFTPESLVKSASEKWARFDGANVVPCAGPTEDPYEQDCFTISARVQRATDPVSAAPEQSAAIAVLLDVTSRVSCGGLPNRCLYVRVQQRIRPDQFYDSLYYYQFSTLDPKLYPETAGADGIDKTFAEENCANRYASSVNDTSAGLDASLAPRSVDCLSVAFQSGDVIDGPITTLDDYIVACGDPEFKDPLNVGAGFTDPTAPNGRRAWATVKDLIDLGSAVQTENCPDPVTTPVKALGAQTFGLYRDFALPTSSATLVDITAKASPSMVFDQDNASTPVNVEFLPPSTPDGNGRVTVTGSTAGASVTRTFADSSDIIVVNAQDASPVAATVSGTVAGRISFFTDGNVRISGNLVYNSGSSSQNTSDVLGLTAGGDIIIAKPASSGEERTVNAVAASLEGSVYTEDWQVSALSGNPGWQPGTLNWLGALSSKYQGVFGGYSYSQAQYVSGFRKAFTFDRRVAGGAITPPYVIQPEKSSWTRLASLEVPPDR